MPLRCSISYHQETGDWGNRDTGFLHLELDKREGLAISLSDSISTNTPILIGPDGVNELIEYLQYVQRQMDSE